MRAGARLAQAAIACGLCGCATATLERWSLPSTTQTGKSIEVDVLLSVHGTRVIDARRSYVTVDDRTRQIVVHVNTMPAESGDLGSHDETTVLHFVPKGIGPYQVTAVADDQPFRGQSTISVVP